MMATEPAQLATLIVTGGAVGFAVAAALWAWRLTEGVRTARSHWQRRITWLEDRLSRADSVFGAHPGLVLVWETPPDLDADGWSSPRVYGSPTALASLVQFADLGSGAVNGPDPATALLDGIADYEARSSGGQETTLRQRMGELMREGKPFSLTVSGPSGRFIEADGRAAGSQLVVWIADATIRGLEESGARGRLEEARSVVAEDPLAFLDMLGKAPFPAWRISASGRLHWVNPAYVEAVEGKGVGDVIERQLLLEPGLPAHAGEALKAAAPVAHVRSAAIKGERRALDVVVFPVSGGVAGAAFDITRGEEARVALKRFREAHDETLNHMAEAVAIFDRTKQLIFYNRAFARLFALEEAVLNDHPSHGALMDRLREDQNLPIAANADYKTWKAAELSHYERPPGTETPDELWPLPDGRTLRVARQRHPLGGVLLIFEDMTDQLALQARYNTLIKVQRATLDRLHEAVAVFGPEGDLQLHNLAFETLWKLDPALLDGADFDVIADACHPLYPDREAWAELKARITDASPDSRTSKTSDFRRSDGSVLTSLTRPLPDGATLIAWDNITDSRLVEEALRDRAEALEASEKIKTGFVGHVSYQLRTPLTTIGGYADLLAGGFAGELTDRQKDPVTAIQTASAQLAKLIDDILDIAAIDAGQLELDLGDTRLDELASDAAELIASRAEHAGIKLSVKAEKAGSAVRADAARIKQVLYNLLSNALDHVEKGGKIEIGAAVKDGEAQIWVADNGAGIDKDKQAAVFERFERGQSNRAGAGLGLALVKEIVRLHGGWVELDSTPGRGTKVTCHLPANATLDHAAPELALPSAGKAKQGKA
ncbi:MAG: two-component signal transduction system histidine kinase with PAS sensory domain [Oceanicaulis sp. HLUCCA04]|nr:MAG: two-component signal transduction system histidine kinase with PAS sensory domain [Oceanicaulis sp. HLUCCA04]